MYLFGNISPIWTKVPRNRGPHSWEPRSTDLGSWGTKSPATPGLVHYGTHRQLNSFHGFRAVTVALETEGPPIDNR
jgi:hypothetical protein